MEESIRRLQQEIIEFEIKAQADLEAFYFISILFLFVVFIINL